MEPPAHHSGPRSQARDQHTSRSAAIPVAREITADDFSRSTWRDGASTSHRELYNSHSGRYEPVTDRRGSFRAEMRPSLLQRPHHSTHDNPDPTPSSHGSRPIPDPSFGRRRGSSSVGGSSGPLQRPGKPLDPGSIPPSDALHVRRGSLAASTDSHVSRSLSQAGQQGGRPQDDTHQHPHVSPVPTKAAPLHPNSGSEPIQATQTATGTSGPFQSEEQVVEYQKRLMKEKREEAIKRRLEEEAREEAAKAERIRLKLAAMGPPPERKSNKKEAGSIQDARSPTTIAARPAVTVLPSAPGNSDAQTHGPTEQASQTTDATLTSPASPAQKNAEPSNDTTAQVEQSGLSSPSQPQPWDGPGQSPSRLTSWPSSGHLSRNVWGSPNNDRGLGNGTFDPDLGRVPESRAAPIRQRPLRGPAPIAPPTLSRMPNRTQPPEPVYPTLKNDRYTAAEPRQYTDKQNQWVGAVMQADSALRDQRNKGRQELEHRLADQGLNIEQAQATIKHTWRPESSTSRMEMGDHAGGPSWDRPKEDHPKQTVTAVQDGLSANSLIGPNSSPLLTSGASTASPPSRLSRFFPSKDKDARNDVNSRTVADRGESPSPPPPTMDDHPVYDGDVSHPQVSFPRPQPVVRLPPARAATSRPTRGQRPDSGWPSAIASSHKGGQVSGATNLPGPAQAASAPHGAPQSQQEWQKKIDQLTGRKAPPPKVLVVDSATRHALDQTVQQQPATVSLPSQIAVRGSGEVTSKPMAEECFEEQEMGSLPPVNMPRNSSPAAWQPAPPPHKPFPRALLVTSQTVRFFDISDYSKPVIHVSLPGMRQAKSVPYSHNTGRTNSRGSGHGRSGGRHRASGTGYRGGNAGKRDPSSYANDSSANQQSASTSASASRGRGSFYRRSGETWQPRTSAHPSNT
jgi:hypothetical protein